MHGVGSANVLTQALAIRQDVANVNREQRAAVSRALTRVIGNARPAVKDEAEKIAHAAVEGVVETLDFYAPVKNWVDTGNYIDFANEEHHIFPWEKGAANNQAKRGQYDLIQWVGFAVNPDVQLATLREIIEKASVELHWGDASTPTRRVPLENFLFTRIGRFFAQGALDSGAAPLVEHVTLHSSGTGFYFDPNRFMVVTPGDRDVHMRILGLSGSVAGSSPALTMQYRFRGVRIRV
jgi:hypothetical protein